MPRGQKFDVGTLSSTITTDPEEIFHHSGGYHSDPARELLRAEATLESVSAAVRSFIFEDRRSSKRIARCPKARCIILGLLKLLIQYLLSCAQAWLIVHLCYYALRLWPNECKDQYWASHRYVRGYARSYISVYLSVKRACTVFLHRRCCWRGRKGFLPCARQDTEHISPQNQHELSGTVL